MPPPRRSLLFMPGSNARALEKARTLPADGLILEVHPEPERSMSDAAQTITLDTLARIIQRGHALHDLLADEPAFESVAAILHA